MAMHEMKTMQNPGEWHVRIPGQGMITIKPLSSLSRKQIKRCICTHQPGRLSYVYQVPWHVADDEPGMEQEKGNLPRARLRNAWIIHGTWFSLSIISYGGHEVLTFGTFEGLHYLNFLTKPIDPSNTKQGQSSGYNLLLKTSSPWRWLLRYTQPSKRFCHIQ